MVISSFCSLCLPALNKLHLPFENTKMFSPEQHAMIHRQLHRLKMVKQNLRLDGADSEVLKQMGKFSTTVMTMKAWLRWWGQVFTMPEGHLLLRFVHCNHAWGVEMFQLKYYKDCGCHWNHLALMFQWGQAVLVDNFRRHLIIKETESPSIDDKAMGFPKTHPQNKIQWNKIQL